MPRVYTYLSSSEFKEMKAKLGNLTPYQFIKKAILREIGVVRNEKS